MAQRLAEIFEDSGSEREFSGFGSNKDLGVNKIRSDSGDLDNEEKAEKAKCPIGL